MNFYTYLILRLENHNFHKNWISINKLFLLIKFNAPMLPKDLGIKEIGMKIRMKRKARAE